MSTVSVYWGIDGHERKDLPQIWVGENETKPVWREFFRHMVHRGQRKLTRVTCDGAPRFMGTTASIPVSIPLGCRFRRPNFRAEIAEATAPEFMEGSLGQEHRWTEVISRAEVISRFDQGQSGAELVFASLHGSSERINRTQDWTGRPDRHHPALSPRLSG